MKEIKFRGLRVDGNGYAVGDLTHDKSGRTAYVDGWEVELGSVDQFAFSEGGRDYYDGDTLRRNGRIYAVRVLPYFEELFSGEQSFKTVNGKK